MGGTFFTYALDLLCQLLESTDHASRSPQFYAELSVLMVICDFYSVVGLNVTFKPRQSADTVSMAHIRRKLRIRTRTCYDVGLIEDVFAGEHFLIGQNRILQDAWNLLLTGQGIGVRS